MMRGVIVALIMGVLCLMGKMGEAQQACETEITFNRSPYTFTQCVTLPVQGATLAWNYFPATSTLSVAYTGTALSATGWVAWGINPTSLGMTGANVFITFVEAGVPVILPYKLTAATKNFAPLVTNNTLDFSFSATATEITGTTMRLLVTLQLPTNNTQVNHVWNRGPSVTNRQPAAHPFTVDSLTSTQAINLSSGVSSVVPGIPNLSLKRTHGVLLTLAWGVILPLGVMSAHFLRRYKSLDPAWFYIHVACQLTGYVLSTIGWGLGLKLNTLGGGSASNPRYRTHYNLGIAIFLFSTLQILAVILRPAKDHKIRKYWNFYHHSVGYSAIVMSIVNIYEGLRILDPVNSWRIGYTATLIILGSISLVAEVVTWIIYLQKK